MLMRKCQGWQQGSWTYDPQTNLSTRSFQFVYLQFVSRTGLTNGCFTLKAILALHRFSSFLGSQSINPWRQTLSPKYIYISMRAMASLKVQQISQQKTTTLTSPTMLKLTDIPWFSPILTSIFGYIVGIGLIFRADCVLVAADGWKMEVTTIHRSQLLFTRAFGQRICFCGKIYRKTFVTIES